jgi:hypothetical protein
MADFDILRIDLGFISDEAAVTTAIDFHFGAFPFYATRPPGRQVPAATEW